MQNLREKFHFLFINLITLQFLLLPVAPAWATDYGDDDFLNQMVENCTELRGTWNTEVNRCIPAKEDGFEAELIERCNAIEDNKAKNACYEQVGTQLAQVGESDEDQVKLIKEQEDLAEQMYYVGIIQLIISSIVGGANSECLSMQVYTKVALANSVVSIGIMFFMDDDTEELREKYEEGVYENMHDGQLAAFTFLKKMLESSKDSAERQAMIHQITGYGYTAASAIAIAEALKPSIAASGCNTTLSEGKSLATMIPTDSEGTTTTKDGETISTEVETKITESDKIKVDTPKSDSGSIWSSLSSYDDLTADTVNNNQVYRKDKDDDGNRRGYSYDDGNKPEGSTTEDIPRIDTDGDGTPDSIDTDGDGKADALDENNNGIPDNEENQSSTQEEIERLEFWVNNSKTESKKFVFSPDYTRDLETALNQVESGTDAYFAYQEVGRFYSGEVHSESIDHYNDIRNANMFEPQSGETESFKEVLLHTSNVFKMASNIAFPEAHAADYMTKAKKVVYGGDDQKFDMKTVMSGGGLVGAKIRSMALGQIIGMWEGPLKETIRGYLSHPGAIAIISGVSAYYQFQLQGHAEREAKIVEKQIEAIDLEIARLMEISDRYCLEGRDDISNLRCYCYTSGGLKNPDRVNSEACNAFWFVGDGEAEDSGIKRDIPKDYGCVTVAGHYDPECKCVSYTDKVTGQDACMDSNLTTSVGFNAVGESVGLSELNGALSDAYSGDLDSGNLSEDDLAKLAARAGKTRKMLADKYNEISLAKGRKPLPSESQYGKIMNNILSKAKATPFHMAKAASKLALKSGNKKLNKDAINKALKATGLEKKFVGNGKGISKKSGKKKPLASDGRGKKNKVERYMEKKYKYNEGVSDIIGSSKSIFKVISSRYQKTAMPLLFPDE